MEPLPYRRKQRIRMEGWMDRKQRIEWIEWIGEGEGEGEKGRRRRIGWKEGLDGLVRVTGFQCIV